MAVRVHISDGYRDFAAADHYDVVSQSGVPGYLQVMDADVIIATFAVHCWYLAEVNPSSTLVKDDAP